MTGLTRQKAAADGVPALDALTAGIDVAYGSEGGRNHTSYTDAQRATGALIATLLGLRTAARRLDVPERTLYDWLKAYGGLTALRDAARDTLAAHQYAVAVLACERLVERLDDASIEQLLDVVRLLGVVGARPRGEAADVEPGAATPILVQFNVASDGKPAEIISVPPSPPATPGEREAL